MLCGVGIQWFLSIIKSGKNDNVKPANADIRAVIKKNRERFIIKLLKFYILIVNEL